MTPLDALGLAARASRPRPLPRPAHPREPGPARLQAPRLHAARRPGTTGSCSRTGWSSSSPRTARCPSSTSRSPSAPAASSSPRARRGSPAFTGAPDPPRGHDEPHRRGARREARLPGRAGLDRHRRHVGRGQPELPLRQPRRVAQGLRGDAARAALPGGPPGARQGAGAPGDEEAQRRLRGHRGAASGTCCSTARTHFTNRFTTEASVQADHPRRPRGLPPRVLPPREHDRGGLGLVLAART